MELPNKDFFKLNDPQINLPESFFTHVIPNIKTLAHLKLCLYFLWRQEKIGDLFNGIHIDQIIDDEIFSKSFNKDLENELIEIIQEALDELTNSNILINTSFISDSNEVIYYFVNNPVGNFSRNAIINGKWHPNNQINFPLHLVMSSPNIYKLYEENIGPITPLLSDILKDAEEEYPAEWFEEAFKKGIENNVRKWKYIEAILKNWKENGKVESHNREIKYDRNRKYSEGEDAEFFQN